MPRISRALQFGTFLLGIFLGFAVSAHADKIIVVMNPNVAPYREALQGFTQTGQAEVRQVALDEVPRESFADAAAVLGFGAEAMALLEKNPPAAPLFYTMVLEPITFQHRKLSGVVMQIPLSDQLAYVPKILPKAKKVGVVYNLQFSAKTISQAREIVTGLGLTLAPVAVETPEEVEGALSNLAKQKIEVLLLVLDPTAVQPASVSRMIRFALDNRVPFIGLTVFHVKAGAMAAFSIDYPDLGAQTGELAAKVLADRSLEGRVETPRKIRIFVNRETERRLGIGDLPPLPEITYLDK